MLEWIAMLTMLLDHIGLIFFPEEKWLRVIGRMAFPLYCWGIVQGYYQTRNVEHYMGRLLVLALLSQLPYAYAFELPKLNVIFTLLLGLLAIYVYDRIENYKIALLFLIALLSSLIPMDYGIYGISLMIIYHLWRGRETIQAHLGLNLFCLLFFGWLTQMFSLLATLLLTQVPVLGRYRLKGGFRWVYRLFYPAHLLILYVLKLMMEG